MPRSFLVKKIKGDGFQCSGVPAPTYHPLETAYVLPGARGPSGDNGYAPHCLPPSSYDADQKPGLELAPAEPAYPPAAPEEYSDPESPQSSLSARYFRGEAAVTDSYSMDCGKTYATSSNLSRHKQTHRSLDSQLARKCPTCGKAYVSMPALAMHVLTHNLRHKCGVCGKAFSRPWLLQGHICVPLPTALLGTLLPDRNFSLRPPNPELASATVFPKYIPTRLVLTGYQDSDLDPLSAPSRFPTQAPGPHVCRAP
nr:PREDICTED: transcriptional repressor scratch 2 [Bos mutus]